MLYALGWRETPKAAHCICVSIIGLVVEFVVAIDEARVRFTDDATVLFLMSFCSSN